MIFLVIIYIVLSIFNIFFSLYLFSKNKEKISNIKDDITLINESLQKLSSDLQASNIDFDETIKKNVKYLERMVEALKYEFTVRLIDVIRSDIKSLVNGELEKQHKNSA
jgi:thioredoxin-related protein